MAIFPSPGLGEAIVIELRNGPLLISDLLEALKQRGFRVTDQGVYKAIRSLRQNDIVFFQRKEISLNVRWLQRIETLITLSQHAYTDPKSGSGNFLSQRDGDRIVYSFKNPIQVDAFWNHVLYILFDAIPNLDRWYAYSSHHWFSSAAVRKSWRL